MAQQNCADARCHCKVEHGTGVLRVNDNYSSTHCAKQRQAELGQM
jgi:hypothetical protein